VWQSGSKASLSAKIKVLSPAKLNLYLNILGRYSKRFNRIESIVERISLFDEIVITQKPSRDITISCNRPELAVDDNLCAKAARLLQNKLRLSCGFHIELTKKIPVGAGLGGGSSNCASVLIAINQMLELGLSKDDLYKLGKKLGSDVNFFVSESSYALMEGRGEKITPFDGGRFNHVVIYPSVHLATKLVYQHTHYKLTKLLLNAKIMQNALARSDVMLAKVINFNALEKPAMALCRQIREVKQRFGREGIDFRVTGSGSALYAFLSVKDVQKFMKRKLPKSWQAFAVNTF
jgi:4-diphosphocytidyl-2-C-methyl-D-erythritol kinase